MLNFYLTYVTREALIWHEKKIAFTFKIVVIATFQFPLNISLMLCYLLLHNRVAISSFYFRLAINIVVYVRHAVEHGVVVLLEERHRIHHPKCRGRHLSTLPRYNRAFNIIGSV